VTYAVRRLRARMRKHFFDIRDLAALPARFVYYPLHFQPEASLTSRDAYFVDQLRAVDLIRSKIPSDLMLVAKEHPAMKGIREPRFYSELRARAGVLLADYALPNAELVRRAALTVSISGTAVLEALLLGKSSLLLGHAFFRPWVAHWSAQEDLAETVRRAIAETPEAIEQRAVDCVARIRAIGYDFALWDPYDPGVDPRYTMSQANVAAFFHGLLDHQSRLEPGYSAAKAR
jgi:hypothetical protein